MGQLLKKKYGVLRAGFFHGVKRLLLLCSTQTREGECLVIDAACVFFLELAINAFGRMGFVIINYGLFNLAKFEIWVSTNKIKNEFQHADLNK